LGAIPALSRDEITLLKAADEWEFIPSVAL
jgi:hypothetical protein